MAFFSMIFSFGGFALAVIAVVVLIRTRKNNSPPAVIFRIVCYFALIPLILYIAANIVTRAA